MLKWIIDWISNHEFSEYMKKRPIIGPKTKVLPSGDQVDYIEFHGDPRESPAQYYWGRIIVSDYIFNNFSENTQNVVIAHEFGHKRMSSYASIPLIFVMITCCMGFLFLSVMGVLMALMLFLFQKLALVDFAILTFGLLLWAIIFLLGYMAASWISEGYAEITAIRIVGLEAYNLHLKEREEKKHLRKSSLFERIRCSVSYPPKTLVIWVHSKCPIRK